MLKITAGALVAGALAAGLFGAGTASAAPGISVSVNGHDAVGIGDQKLGSGAAATSSKGNASLAVSLIGPATASANSGSGNTAVALLGGTAVVAGPNPTNNHATAVGGAAIIGPRVTVGDDGPVVEDATDSNVVSVLSVVQTSGGSVSTIAFCGGSINAQSVNLSTSKLPVGTEPAIC